MMRSLFSGVTGLRSHQTKMDVIGNNISNVNTLGFKKSQVNFADLYSETTSQASAPTGNNGGVNAKQIGLGVATNAIVIKHNAGAAQYTGNTLDLAIEGDGFFTVRVDNTGERYTRAGNLAVSANGTLVTSDGYFVQCFGSQYQQGTQGVVTGTAGLGEDIATKGFENFTFEPADGAVRTASSGTYTFEMNGRNQINVMKNGVVWQTVQLEVQGDDGNWSPFDGNSFDVNTRFQANIPDLGIIQFNTVKHDLITSGLDKNYPTRPANGQNEIYNFNMVEDSANLTFRQGNNTVDTPTGRYRLQLDPTAAAGDLAIKLVQSITVSEYKKQYGDFDPQNVQGGWSPVPAGSNSPTSFTKDVADPASTANPAASLSLKITRDPQIANGAAGTPDYNTAQYTPANTTTGAAATITVAPGQQYKIDLTAVGLGELRFTAPTGTAGQGVDILPAIEDMVNSFTMTVTAPSTEGPSNINTGINYLDSLFQGASVSITNNDGFQSLNRRGDMIIDQNLYENVSIGSDGSVVAQLKQDWTSDDGTRFAKGEKVILGYVALATFANYEGLEKVGANLYNSTQNSGRPVYNLAGEGGTGELASSSLEMSNVDLSEEFVNMITTQRGFQANSRIITTSDTMLEELINLKR